MLTHCLHRALLGYQTTFSPPEDISLTTLVGTTVTMTWRGAFLPRMHQQGIDIIIDIFSVVVCLNSVHIKDKLSKAAADLKFLVSLTVFPPTVMTGEAATAASLCTPTAMNSVWLLLLPLESSTLTHNSTFHCTASLCTLTPISYCVSYHWCTSL